LPHPARQAYAQRKGSGMRTLVELLKLRRWQVPGFYAAQQLLLLVNSPNGAHRPVKTLTNGLKDQRGGADQGWRLGKYARDRVLGSQARLLSLSFRDIRRDSVNESSFRAENSRPEQPFVGSILTAVAILERNCVAAGSNLCGFSGRGLAGIGVHKLKIGVREQFFSGEAEGRFPSRIYMFEIAVRAGDTQGV